MATISLLVLATLLSLATCQGALPPKTLPGHRVPGVNCQSWRLAVETNNIIDWKVPKECEPYVAHYMLGPEYHEDSKTVVDEAILYAQSLKIPKDGRSIWVFDVDETSLSNLPYYAQHGFGAESFNSSAFKEWILTGKAPALPETLRLYKKVLSLGIKVVFLTGRSSYTTDVTATNLQNAGYHTWEKLITRSDAFSSATALFYKSSQRALLVKQGYRIVGNIGDQWSDLQGPFGGGRLFKLPNPVYYVA